MHLEIMEARDLDFIISYLRFRKDVDDIFFVSDYIIMTIDCDILHDLRGNNKFDKQINYIDYLLFSCVPI